ncbi:protein sym1 [Aspergillus cavernicola]|uniref:Protein sym1 n=1 Tax=Aspergillus cavernicola TaxID=176166 RepID=A0ABR4I6W6_9EURO
MFRWYQSKLAKQPILTTSITSAVLFGSGDVLAQQLVDRRGFEKHDMARTGRMAFYGGVIFGPAATIWMGFLQRNVVLKNSKATIAARVAADQCLFAPTHLTCFLTYMAVLEGKDPIEKWKSSFLPIYKANLTIWPMVQCFNFAVVPLEYRVLFANVISLGWNCLLSLINSGET